MQGSNVWMIKRISNFKRDMLVVLKSIHTTNWNLAFIPYWNHQWNTNIYSIKSNRRKMQGSNVRMIKKDFKFQTWHAMWSWGLYIFLLLTSGSSRWLVFERIFLIHHNLHDGDGKEWEIGWSKSILNFKRDTLYKVQTFISSFFWLQGPPYDLYLKEYS